jgi:class 3 adenylate cyclase
VQRVGAGDHDVRVPVDDAGEIGLLQEGVNTMVAGLAERERLRDLFGRHVGTTVAQQAMVTGGSLGGELRTVAALFVDIAGSTSLVLRAGPDQMVGDPVNEAARLADLAKDVPGRVVASAEAVRDAGAGGRQWAPGVVAELRGRHRPTPTWVLRAD